MHSCGYSRSSVAGLAYKLKRVAIAIATGQGIMLDCWCTKSVIQGVVKLQFVLDMCICNALLLRKAPFCDTMKRNWF